MRRRDNGHLGLLLLAWLILIVLGASFVMAPFAMGQDGGVPSRPKFNSVGVGVKALSTNGTLRTTGNISTSAGSISTASGSIASDGTVTTAGTITSTRTLNVAGAYGLFLDANTPALALNATGAAANNRKWDCVAVSDQLRCRVLDDAGSTAVDWLTVDRTDTAVDQVGLHGRVLVRANGANGATAIARIENNDAGSGNNLYFNATNLSNADFNVWITGSGAGSPKSQFGSSVGHMGVLVGGNERASWDATTGRLALYTPMIIGSAASGGATAASLSAGSGSPNGVYALCTGSIYLNTSGGASTTLYVKESGGCTNTGWVAK